MPRKLQKTRTAIGSLKPDPRHGAGRTAPPRGTTAPIIVATVTILSLPQNCCHYNDSNDVIIYHCRFSDFQIFLISWEASIFEGSPPASNSGFSSCHLLELLSRTFSKLLQVSLTSCFFFELVRACQSFSLSSTSLDHVALQESWNSCDFT